MEQHVKKILWIDDDINRYSLLPYIDEFKARNLKIEGASNPDKSDEMLLKQHDFQCIIVDVTMPLGEHIQFDEAKGGMQTGLVYLKKLVENQDLKDVKKVVFTIADDTEVREYCKNQNPEIPYLLKQRYFSNTFAEAIDKIIKEESINLE